MVKYALDPDSSRQGHTAALQARFCWVLPLSRSRLETDPGYEC